LKEEFRAKERPPGGPREEGRSSLFKKKPKLDKTKTRARALDFLAKQEATVQNWREKRKREKGPIITKVQVPLYCFLTPSGITIASIYGRGEERRGKNACA